MEQALLPAPTIACSLPWLLQENDRALWEDVFGENPAWIAIVGCTVLNFSPHPFLLHNFKAMHGKVFFQKLVILVFFQFPDIDIPRLQSFPSQRDGIILRDLNYLLN